LRQKGKIAELALGYGGAVGALTAMGALDMGVKEEELQPLVNSWRDSNPKIVQLWWDVDKCAIDAIKGKKKVELGNIAFEYKSKMLFITLPSGRRLAYVKPKLEPNQFGKEAVTYEGIGVGKKWMRLETYGPKLVENIVQATARDLLVYAMQSLEDVGYEIVMHVHDEVIVEAPPTAELETICALMADGPKWAEGLKLNADGYVCDFYKKE
jgi:DNA polymerase